MRYQECDPVGKVIRWRWYVLYPKYILKYRHAGFKNAHNIAIIEVQNKMKLVYTMAEVKKMYL